MISVRLSEIRATMPQTSALPMKKALVPSVTPSV